jgi:hypothetical protein
MKKYVCVQAKHHNDVGPLIEKHVSEGWHLLTYKPVSIPSGGGALLTSPVTHYLLFEKGE